LYKKREVTGVDVLDGGYLRDVPSALIKLGLDRPYTYETNLTIDELNAATEDGAAIVSVKFLGGLHAVVIDGIEDDMVLIRDPAGSTYKITMRDFKQQWYGVAVIPAP
jgi:ABC-type bacteriocin/lantibiotic exporter with double-glycine peptidase domain